MYKVDLCSYFATQIPNYLEVSKIDLNFKKFTAGIIK